MTKIKLIYRCLTCGHKAYQWLGKCPLCKEWNTFEEEMTASKKKHHESKKENSSQPKRIKEINFKEKQRVLSGITEFDRVMGGGLVAGSLTLIGGEPGIGKSTLLTDLMGRLANKYPEKTVLYVSGEESEIQIAIRLKRLGIDASNLYILNETSWEKIKVNLDTFEIDFFVLDSIQTTVSEEVSGTSGSVSQIREVTHELLSFIKEREITSFIIGHITKDGHIAGPKILEHMVDAVIYFEGDRYGHYRILRAIKNRFGNTNEIGIFEMSEKGLNEVRNTAQYFLGDHEEMASGRCVTCILEGARPLFVEVQALVIESNQGIPRRTVQGLEEKRLSLLIAIIEKYLKMAISFNDIYLNIVNGVRLEKRESDLAIMASLLSSYKNINTDRGTIFLGEVGLSGEIHGISQIESRLSEMQQLGYSKLVTSSKIAKSYGERHGGLTIIGLNNASEIEAYL